MKSNKWGSATFKEGKGKWVRNCSRKGAKKEVNIANAYFVPISQHL